jgi:hypothetical protein
MANAKIRELEQENKRLREIVSIQVSSKLDDSSLTNPRLS